jgi:hypothetical protein
MFAAPAVLTCPKLFTAFFNISSIIMSSYSPDQHRPNVIEHRVSTEMFGSMGEEEKVGWRKLMMRISRNCTEHYYGNKNKGEMGQP